MEILIVSTKLFIGFILLFLLIKFVGKKLVNQLTPFTFISAIVLSELVGNAVYDPSVPTLYIFHTMILWGIFVFVVEYLGMKSLWLRKTFEGKPSMVIRNGKIDYDQLKKANMNINQLQSLLRQSEIFSVREVAYAFIESNGAISVLKKSPYQKTTQEDFEFAPTPVHLPITLIRDGEVIEANLKEINQTMDWLKQELLKQNVSGFQDVFFAEWLEGDGLYVSTYKQGALIYG